MQWEGPHCFVRLVNVQDRTVRTDRRFCLGLADTLTQLVVQSVDESTAASMETVQRWHAVQVNLAIARPITSRVQMFARAG